MKHSFEEIYRELADSWAESLQIAAEFFLVSFSRPEVLEVKVDFRRLLRDNHVVRLEITNNLVNPLHLSIFRLFYLRP